MDKPVQTKPLSNIKRFQKKIEEKYGVKFNDYWEFHKWSVKHYEKIWAETFEFFEIIHSQPYTKVLERHERLEENSEWFLGSRMNFTENMLRHNEEVALLLLGEERESPEEVTYKQLRDEVSTISSALRKAGIKSGDVIACYLSARKEALVSMLAAGALGAIFTSVNPLMGVEAISNRFQQISPKVLFTIDRHLYDNEEKDVLKNLPQIVKAVPGIELVVIVPSNAHSLRKCISHVPKSCFYPDFMATGLDQNGKPPEPYYEQLPFSHPFIVNFTSGTTGLPKGIVHSLGGVLVSPMKELSFIFDIRPNDVVFLIHLPGWATFNCFFVGLAFGITNVLYEGLPYFNQKPSYWDLIDTYKITSAFLTPTTIEEMDKRNLTPGPNNSLKTLRTLVSGSSPVHDYVHDIVYNRIKKDISFSSLYGITEFIGMLAGPNQDLPVRKGEIQVPLLGVDLLCYDESGKTVFDELGEIVVVNPWPSQLLCVWKNGKFEKYSGPAVDKFPGVWWIGDMGIRNSKTGGLVIPGRCDTTIKNLGARYGSSEIYAIVNKMQEVDDSICVSRIIKSGHEVAVLFIKMKQGYDLTAEFEKFVRQRIKDELSLLHVPQIIRPVKGIPINMNGKKMEALVKQVLNGIKKIQTGVMRNPECLAEYMEYAKSTY